MIQKIHKGQTFAGVLEYVLHKGRSIGTNMLGSSVRELAREFEAIQRLRPRLKTPVFHSSLSLSSGEHLDDERWNRLALAYLHRLGFNDCQHVIARHCDTGHEHVHIIASRVRRDGSVVADSNDYPRGEQICRRLETEFNLRHVESAHVAVTGEDGKVRYLRATERRAVKSSALRRSHRTGQRPLFVRMQEIIDEARHHCQDFRGFVRHLSNKGVTLIPHGDTGEVSGCSYRLGDLTMNGADLGQSYTWGAIAQATDFDTVHDAQLVAKLRSHAGSVSDRNHRLATDARIVPLALGFKRRMGGRILGRAFLRTGDRYVWRNRRQRRAFEITADGIHVKSINSTAVKASIQLARSMGWLAIRVIGSVEFRREAWRQARLSGFREDKILGFDAVSANRSTGAPDLGMTKKERPGHASRQSVKSESRRAPSGTSINTNASKK